MPTLYITQPGARVEKEYQRLVVTKDDQRLLRVPLQRVSLVVAVGRVGLTTPAVHALLQHQIPIHFVTRTGKLLGRLLPPTTTHLPRRQAQYARNNDPDFALALAKAISIGKIRNQRTMALRLNRRYQLTKADQHLALMQKSCEQIPQAIDLNHVRGLEGTAARAYFACLRQTFDPIWQFNNRNRRPPKDPINAVLSLGYTMLTHSMMTALETAQLDPYLGYFHAEKQGRPALALDLIEEFRTPVVDSLVLTLFNLRQLSLDDFQANETGDGVVLSDRGLTIFFTAFSKRLEKPFTYRPLKRKLTFRKLFEVQAQALAKYIEGKQPEYQSFRFR